VVDSTIVGSAYDELASGYDEELQRDGWMRRRLWRHFDRLFGAGDRVLDVGCGTGIDTVHLAARGVRVSAIDGSSEMIARLRAKTKRMGALSAPDIFVGQINDVLAGLSGPFDGVVSSFAALNTVALDVFAESVWRLLRPRARVVCHMLSPGFHGRLAGVRRALFGGTSRAPEQVSIRLGGRAIEHLNLHPLEIHRRYFARYFERRACYALGLLVTPGLEGRLPSHALDLLGGVEAMIGSSPPVLSLGRFFVLDLQRRA
jgi:SAM-dependent methyltransferase